MERIEFSEDELAELVLEYLRITTKGSFADAVVVFRLQDQHGGVRMLPPETKVLTVLHLS